MWPFTKKQELRHSLSASNLYEAIRDQLSGRMASHCTIRLADREQYATCSDAEARRWVSQAAAGFYSPEVLDCDDFCFKAKSYCIDAQFKVGLPLAFGIVWTPDHSMNLYLNHELKIRVIDQDGSLDRETKEINLILC